MAIQSGTPGIAEDLIGLEPLDRDADGGVCDAGALGHGGV